MIYWAFVYVIAVWAQGQQIGPDWGVSRYHATKAACEADRTLYNAEGMGNYVTSECFPRVETPEGMA